MRHPTTLVMIAAAMALLLFLVVSRHEPAPHAGENGTFANDCCGTIALSDGRILLNDRATVRYVVGKDAEGPYILPDAYVGPFPDMAFEVDGTRSVLKLRLDKLPAPTRIVLYQGERHFTFTRQKPRVRR